MKIGELLWTIEGLPDSGNCTVLLNVSGAGNVLEAEISKVFVGNGVICISGVGNLKQSDNPDDS